MEFEERFVINIDEIVIFLIKMDQRLYVHNTRSEKHHLQVILTIGAAGDTLPPVIIFVVRHQLNDICPHDFVTCVQELMKPGWFKGFMSSTNVSPSTTSLC